MKIKIKKDIEGIPVYESIVRVEVIGYTKSGRKIYLDSHDIEHALYEYEDHVDAEALHKVLRNQAYIDAGVRKHADEHNMHAHNHRKAGLLGVDKNFEVACLNHVEKLNLRMSELKTRSS